MSEASLSPEAQEVLQSKTDSPLHHEGANTIFLTKKLSLDKRLQSHPYLYLSSTPPHHFQLWLNYWGLFPKPNLEPPFCDVLSIDQLLIS